MSEAKLKVFRDWEQFPTNDAKEWFDKGIDLFVQRKYEEAITCYNKAKEITMGNFLENYTNSSGETFSIYVRDQLDTTFDGVGLPFEIIPKDDDQSRWTCWTCTIRISGSRLAGWGLPSRSPQELEKVRKVLIELGRRKIRLYIKKNEKSSDFMFTTINAKGSLDATLESLDKELEDLRKSKTAKEIDPRKYWKVSHPPPSPDEPWTGDKLLLGRIRISALAKELSVKSSLLIEQCHLQGFTHVKHHANTLTKEEAEKIKEVFDVKKAHPSPPPKVVTPPATRVHRDRWTTDDSLGYKLYARAITKFIQHEDSKPPFTISIQAPWGQGKTSLMKMIQKRLDPDHPDFVKEGGAQKPHHDSMLNHVVAIVLSVLKKLKGWFKKVDVPLELTKLKNPTVWFNPWKYQNSEQIWAGLAHSILSQLTARLAPPDREKFWLKLQLWRVNYNEIRTEIHRAILKSLFNLASLLFIVCAVGIVFIVGELFNNKFNFFADIGGGFAVAGSVYGLVKNIFVGMSAYRQSYIDKIEDRYLRCVQQHDYVGRMGFLHLVEEDMKRVLKLLVDDKKPAVVFIDDLDRCSPTKVGQVVEAVNMFLSGDYPGCVFVLGIDAQVVAASMAIVHEKIINKIGDRHGEVGWRFMDKFVQLPFVIPQLSRDQQKVYLKKLRKPKEMSRPLSAEVENKAKNILESVHAGKLKFDDAASQFAEITSDPEVATKMGDLGEEVLSAFVQKLSDEDPEMLDELENYIGYLSDNPRTIKRVVNLYRFHHCVSYTRKMSGLVNATPKEIARCVVVFVRWPQFVRWLQAHAQTESSKGDEQNLTSKVIKVIETAQSPNQSAEARAEYLKNEGLEHAGWVNDRDLWRFLREKDISDETLLRAAECGLW